jgi:hypothetical protein
MARWIGAGSEHEPTDATDAERIEAHARNGAPATTEAVRTDWRAGELLRRSPDGGSLVVQMPDGTVLGVGIVNAPSGESYELTRVLHRATPSKPAAEPKSVREQLAELHSTWPPKAGAFRPAAPWERPAPKPVEVASVDRHEWPPKPGSVLVRDPEPVPVTVSPSVGTLADPTTVEYLHGAALDQLALAEGVYRGGNL